MRRPAFWIDRKYEGELHYEFVFMIPGCELDYQTLSSTIMDEFLKLYENDKKWNDIQLKDNQPTRLLLHINLEKKNTDVM